MLRDLNERLVRLAFPLRSAALDALVDTEAERHALRALQSLTAPPADTARAYIERPFVFPGVSRFSDGTYGVLYAANSLITALRESAYHLARIYTDGNAPPMETRRTRLSMRMRGRAEDIRRSVDATVAPEVYDPRDYTVSQQFGAKARAKVQAIHFDSVRNAHGGRCVGAFTPSIVHGARITGQTTLVWDGERFSEEHVITPL
jgi:hypothetical protein